MQVQQMETMMPGSSETTPNEVTFRRALVLCGRALRRRCPACGEGGMWNGWLRLKPACPVCGLKLDRGESDFWIGAYLFNLVAAELSFAVVFVAVVLLTWPTPPWTLLTWAGAAGAVLSPILFYPYTHGIWLAFDLLFRPDRRDEEI